MTEQEEKVLKTSLERVEGGEPVVRVDYRKLKVSFSCEATNDLQLSCMRYKPSMIGTCRYYGGDGICEECGE
jgi:hypothetical protein